MTFHNIRLPEFIEIFAIGAPEFATSIATTISGREIRNADRTYARQKYLIENCRLSTEQFEEFNAFFRARCGQNHSFSFKDFADFRCIGQIIPVLKIESSQFALVKIYNDQINPYIRTITKPEKNTVKVFYDDLQIKEVQINYETGIIIMPHLIDTKKIITVDFHFNVEVRFTSDSFKYTNNPDGSIGLNPIELIEVIS